MDNAKSLVGDYSSNKLGKLTIYFKNNKLYADFGVYVSELVEITDPGKKRVFILLSPPWTRSLELISEKDGFLINLGQEKYTFTRI